MFETIEETLHTFEDGLDLAVVLAVLQQIQTENQGKYISIDVRANEYTDYDYVVHEIQVIGTRQMTEEEKNKNFAKYKTLLQSQVVSALATLKDADFIGAKAFMERLQYDYFK